jgi:molybdopterin converting factor small subunit
VVTFNFKLTARGKVQFLLAEPEPLDTVLQQCAAAEGLRLGGYIAVRKGTVVAADDLIEDGDDIDVFPAISGG